MPGSRTVPPMAVLHGALAWLSAISIVAVVAVALPTAVGWTRTYRALDATLLGQAVATLLAGATGALLAATAHPPADPLHLLYGALAAGLPIVTRIMAQGRAPRSIGRWVAVAALVALGATLRSFMTGG